MGILWGFCGDLRQQIGDLDGFGECFGWFGAVLDIGLLIAGFGFHKENDLFPPKIGIRLARKAEQS